MSSTQENSDSMDMSTLREIFGADFSVPFKLPPEARKTTQPLRLALREIMKRPALDLNMRAIIIFSTMVALGFKTEAKLYIQGLRNMGYSTEQISEIIVQVAYYAGYPRGVDAHILLQEVLDEDAERAKAKGFYYRMPRS